MATRIVTIAHAWGAGGERIGHRVAEALGFRYVDDEIVDLAAKKHGLDASVVADAERRKGVLARMLDDIAAAPMLDPSGTTGYLMTDPTVMPPADALREFIVEAIRETAQRGDVVIVSHAAGIPLAGRDDVLRVLVTASFETRVTRFAERRGIDRAEATKALKDSDAARADYFRRFYHIDHELPVHYDLVINTDRLTPDDAVAIITATARR